MVCVLNLAPKAWRTCWDVPAALCTSPAQGSPAATELQGSVPSPAPVLGCVHFLGMENEDGMWDRAAPVAVQGVQQVALEHSWVNGILTQLRGR